VPHRLAGLSLWIGGSDKTSSSAWAWLDGTPFSYMNWDGLTRHSTKLNRCMAMRLESKTWITDECDVKKPYICKRLSGKSLQKASRAGSSLPYKQQINAKT